MSRVDSLSLAARWLDRGESCRDSAARIAEFLGAAGEIDGMLSTWLLEGLGTSGAFRRADVSARGIEDLLRSRGGGPFVEWHAAGNRTAYSLALWNGLNASFQVTIGMADRRSSAILSFQEAAPRDASAWRELMSAAIRAFEPDSAAVTSHPRSAEWFSYHRDGAVIENPFSPTDVC
ncbi:MAG TPA: hypothetical protein VMB03_28695 [Bryobacteraceae bacterium]|nr:hypothetical protein [Bryobacteraceae bacterium]